MILILRTSPRDAQAKVIIGVIVKGVIVVWGSVTSRKMWVQLPDKPMDLYLPGVN